MKTLGISKHRKSGRSPKSPKLKHQMKREAEKQERKSKLPVLTYTKPSDIPK